MKRGLAAGAGALALMLGGCALSFPWSQAPACPEIRDTSAWRNAMPGPEEKSRNRLIVLVKLESEERWTLSAVDTDEPSVLKLDLVRGGKAVPGNAAYREAPRTPPRRSIEIVCGGDDVARIDRIETVM